MSGGSRNHVLCIVVLLALLAVVASPWRGAPLMGAETPAVAPELAAADKLFDSQNFKEAADAYGKFLESIHPPEQLWHASMRQALSRLRLQEYDEAVAACEATNKRFTGTLREARALRFLGNLYLVLPHQGTTKGGKYHRGRWDQGVHKDSTKADKKRAVELLEKARELYAAFQADPGKQAALTAEEQAGLVAERIGCQFDLAAAVSRFSAFDGSYYPSGGEEEDPGDDTVGEEAEEMPLGGRHGRRWGGPPPSRGLPVDAAGKPIFDPMPQAYSTALPDGQKVKFLLAEISRLDPSELQDDAALALYRRAMLARARFGPSRLDGGGYQAPASSRADEAKRLHELADNEALTLVGTRLARLTLPEDEDVLALLRAVVSKYSKARIAPAAQYAVGLYYQSRGQFKEAVRELERVSSLFPGSPSVGQARSQLQVIRRAELQLEQTGVQLAGQKAAVSLVYRNAAGVHFNAYKLDLPKYFEEVMERIRADREDAFSDGDFRNLNYQLLSEHGKGTPRYPNYIGEKPDASWDVTLNDARDHRYATAKVECPLTEPGCYMIEASCQGRNGAVRNLLMISDLAIVAKQYQRQQLYFVADSRTGQPVAGATLTHFQYWSRWEEGLFGRGGRQHFYEQTRTSTTDASGVALFKPERKFDNAPQLVTMARGPSGALAFHGTGYWYDNYSPSGEWSGRRVAVFTDRPVYRPLQTVKFTAWVRDYGKGEYRPAVPGRMLVRVRDPKGNLVFEQSPESSAYGSLSGEFKLEKAAALGLYQIEVAGTGGAGCRFRVEEYKKPEFEVEVKVKSDLVRLGDKVDGTIQARYYFGAPVTKAKVTYKLFREEFTYRYTGPAYWDWLYGPGYGGIWYDYAWMPWWKDYGPRCFVWYPWWGARATPERELVAEGAGELGEDGTLAVQVDTTAALRDHPDQDHVYTIEAEVVDASRRNVKGSGQIKVTRQEFYSFLEVDRGYYQPGEQIFVSLKALTANDVPVASKGKLTVAAIRYRGEKNAEVTEEPLESMEASTDGAGSGSLTLKAAGSGQYRLSYETRDSKGRPVIASRPIWVRGADFQGGTYRFSDLEILTDKKTYAPGETAHLMLNTSKAGASVLFSQRTDRGVLENYRVIPLPQKSTVVDLPIEAGDTPNFFVEATAIIDGVVRQEARELFVPPAGHVMNLEVLPGKAEYRPGEEASVKLRATTPDGKPVTGEFALSVFDRSVLYIQPEFTPDLRTQFWGQKRSHGFQMSSNLQLTFSSLDYLQDPAQHAENNPPPDWQGSWGTRWVDFGSDDLEGGAGLGNYAMAVGSEKSKASGGMMMDKMSLSAAGPGAPAPSMALAESKEEAGGAPAEAAAQAQPAYQAAKVRSEFDDTAFWSPTVLTDASGEATVKFRFPENLTTWRMRVLGMTEQARVGDGSGSAVTTKKFVLRLQAPRFFVERDRVTLSANLHNYLAADKKAKVTLTVPAGLMELTGPASVEVNVPAGKEARVDWEVAVLKEGFAVVKMEGLTDEESDAVEMGFPVLVHGLEKTVSKTGLMRPKGADFAELELDVPAERRPEASRLEVRFSPSLAGAMIEAVPYLLDYPYGCTEQTMSRFLPAVMVQKSLLEMGVSLEDLEKAHSNLNSQELGNAGERHQRQQPLGARPVYSQKALAEIVSAGLQRLANFQHSDGGWGWWPDDTSSAYMTAYVIWGLSLAAANDVSLPNGMLARGFGALERHVVTDVKDWRDGTGANDQQAFLAYALSLGKKTVPELNKLLMERRLKLSLYGKALLSLALRNAGRSADADLVLQNIRQFEKHDEENQTAFYDLPQDGWWFWWNNDIETHAWILKAIVAKDPADEFAPGIVKWLLNNRRNGTYWRSTRDTALALTALIEFMRATKETAPDYTLRVLLDGKPLKEVRVTRENMFGLDNRISLAGDQLASGLHKLRFERKGQGAVYFSSYLTYFTKEEGIGAAGLEVKVERKYYKLVRSDRTETVQGARLQDVQERHVRYERLLLKDGDKLASGDQLEVELRLIAKNDYDYLVFEDFKPAGCEPVELRSGSRFGELCSNMELRDEKVAFFVGWLAQGEHLIKYRLRAEIPGVFHALPTKGWAMYAPEIKANAAEMILGVTDK